MILRDIAAISMPLLRCQQADSRHQLPFIWLHIDIHYDDEAAIGDVSYALVTPDAALLLYYAELDSFRRRCAAERLFTHAMMLRCHAITPSLPPSFATMPPLRITPIAG